MSQRTDKTKPVGTKSLDLRKGTHRRELQRPANPGIRQTLYDVIFEAETPSGRAFDIGLLIAILISIAVVAIETVPDYNPARAYELKMLPEGTAEPPTPLFFVYSEWILTGLFTIEYILRLCCVRSPLRYALSFWGIIDLLSVAPTYLSLGGTRSLSMLRGVRLLRVFRVLKLWRMMSDADELSGAIWNSRHKIAVFLTVVLVAVTIAGSLVFTVESALLEDRIEENDFTSIPEAMYWAVVTMTTVGYGDIVPHTIPGKIISAMLILLGYSLIIVPTGFVSAELAGRAPRTGEASDDLERVACETCDESVHLQAAEFCHRCGTHLDS